MRFIPVKGPSITKNDVPIGHYFDDYLISIAGNTRANWNLHQLSVELKRILKRSHNPLLVNSNLYLDSGGFQMIVQDIKQLRFVEYIDAYHTLLEYFYNDIDKIFSLDINNPKSKEWTLSDLIRYNDYSISQSTALIQKIPEIKEKQLFVIQSRSTQLITTWLNLMEKYQVYDNYKHYSFGGLVKFRMKESWIIPMTFWLISWLKSHNKKLEGDLHFLGQGSELVMFTTVILEKLLDINITMDSSACSRIAPLVTKLPLVKDTKIITSLDETIVFFENVQHSGPVFEPKEAPSYVMFDVNSQHMQSCTSLANSLPLEALDWSEEELCNFSDIFKHGTLATRLLRNFAAIRRYQEIGNATSFLDADGLNQQILDLLKAKETH